ncbi:MAG: diacylglycerol/lipid kinase family protein [Gemmatimonadaceae bacterium]
MSNAQRIPAFVNPESGTAEGARDALSVAGLFDIREVDPSTLRDEVRKAVDGGARRVLVSGGDGSIRAGAASVAGTGVELAVLPAGTLNHFARDHGIPTDFEKAARVAAGGTVENADAGYVGDEIFLNTSSIGAYVSFMRIRERLERRFGYRLASLIASIRTFFYMRTMTVELEVDGKKQAYRTPIVFIGVDERELQMPTLGNRVDGGRRCLHVMVVSSRAKARLLSLAWEAVRRGVDSAARMPELDTFMVDTCTISTRRHSVTIAIDGEEMHLATPLEYRIEKDILRIVTESPAATGERGDTARPD